MKKISFCITAYNEDEVFDKCLSSISTVADEIIIVFEPGTNQKTLDIANKYTQNIFTDPLRDWSTSFNYSNSLATGDYLINWDADFVLRSTSQDTLTELKKKNFDDMDSLVINWNIEFTPDYTHPLKWVKRKLIHKKGLYTFSHPLHPRHVFLGQNKEKVGYYPQIEVDHYNTFAGRKPRYERFLEIMKKEVEANPNNAESLFYYGEELIFAKQFTTAHNIWIRYLKNHTQDPLNRLVFGISKFCHVCIELGLYTEALETISKYKTFFEGKSAVFDLIASDVYLTNNMLEKAIEGYQNFITKYSESEIKDSIDLTDYYRLSVYPYYILAKINHLMGDLKTSIKYAKIAKKNNLDPAYQTQIDRLLS